MPLTALVTRPEEDARPLAEALQARGLAVVIEPLLTIRPLPEAAAGLAEDLAGVQALLFTSANGARAFAALSPRRDIGVLAVGDATAAAARGLGFADVESAAGNVDDLARLARWHLKPTDGPLFHAAGSAVAGDLAQLLATKGFELRRRMLYESRPAEAFTAESLAALKNGAIDLVLLFSPRTAASFALLAKAAGLSCKTMTALCLSPNVAEVVSRLDWKTVETAAEPDMPAMLALVDRRLASAKPAEQRAWTASEPEAKAKPEAGPKAAASIIPQSQAVAESPPKLDPLPEAIRPRPAPAEPAPQAAAQASHAPPASPAPRVAPAPAVPHASPAPPSTPVPSTPPAAPRARAGFGGVLLAAIFGAALAGAALFGVMKYAPEQLNLLPAASGLAGGEALADLARRIEDLRGQISDLRGRLDSLPRPDLGDLPQRLAVLEQKVAALQSAGAVPTSAPLPAQMTDLPGRVAVLESKLEQMKPEAMPAELAALPSQIAALQQRIAALEARAPVQPGASIAALSAFQADLAEMKDSLAALDARLKATAAEAGAALALGDLRRAVEAGRPYAGALDGVKKVAAGDGQLSQALDPAIAALMPTAESGAPALGDLQAGLSEASAAILAGASAPEAASQAPAGASFTDRVLAKLQSLVSIEPVTGSAATGEPTGDTPPAHVARAEAKLAAGDLEGAVAEISALSGKPADAAAPWLARAKSRLQAEKALGDMDDAVLAALVSRSAGQ